jgi:D-alanyl-D-alanine dipeptidase
MKDMPHGTWLSIDVTLFDLKNNKILILHKKKDWVDWFLRTFYENKDNEISYYRNVLETIMYKYGFKNLNHEYFHFNFIKI